MEMQAEAEHIKRAESLQSEGDQQSEIKSTQRRATRLRQCWTTCISSRSRRTGSTEAEALKRSTSMSPAVSAKTVKTEEAKDVSKSETEMVDVTDTLRHAISIIEMEIAENLTVLAEGNRHTEHELRDGMLSS